MAKIARRRIVPKNKKPLEQLCCQLRFFSYAKKNNDIKYLQLEEYYGPDLMNEAHSLMFPAQTKPKRKTQLRRKVAQKTGG